MKSICVYLGAKSANDPSMTKAVLDLGEIIAQNKIRLIYGGSSLGLMGQLANAVLHHNGQVTGVISKDILNKEPPLDTLDELIVTETMQERKHRLQQLSDAFIVFPGGLGTLEEAFETWNAIKIGYVTAPIGFLNLNDYYSKLFEFIKNCGEYGLINAEHMQIPILHNNVQDLFSSLNRLKPK